MKTLMIGWEYPPHISGGLGIVCEGLTKGLARIGIDIDFVLPSLVGDEDAPHMALWDHEHIPPSKRFAIRKGVGNGDKITTWAIPAHLHPYMTAAHIRLLNSTYWDDIKEPNMISQLRKGQGYGPSLFENVSRFTKTVLQVSRGLDFDLIHAHDWMTFPAAVTLAQETGKPLVVHIHSLEHDRSGLNGGNGQIQAIERTGLEVANQAITVSDYTRSRIHEFYRIPLEKIAVVYNGIYPKKAVQTYRKEETFATNVVLFLGRVTYQKGPDYFVEAAAKVIPHIPDTTFVIAGTGDMLPQVRHRVRELGLDKQFYFPGFLTGSQVERIFSLADLYVMPSVSEPFGIVALEAINYEKPILISKQSGVSEVLNHALKFDFWDIDQLANLMIGALRYSELRHDLVTMARQELKKLHWDAAAKKTHEIYQELTSAL